MSKRAKIITAVVVLVIAVGAVAYLAFGNRGSGPEIETATAAKQELAVTVSASGDVESGVYADIYPPSSGTLDMIEVSDGETVTAGQTIARMDTEPLELQVSQAQAALDQAEAGLAGVGATVGNSNDVDAARKGVTAAERSVTAAKASQSAAKSAYENAKDAYELAKSVYPSSSTTVTAALTSKKQAYAGYKSAQAGVTQAESGLASAKSALTKAKSARSSASDSKAAAEAGVTQARKALTIAKQALKDATLEAPIDGVVLFNSTVSASGSSSPPTEGSAVSQAAAPFTVVDLSGLKFTAEVDEADVERVEPGMSATVTLDAFPGEEFETTVTRVNPAAQSTATGGTIFPVELDLSDTAKHILLGMKGDATIEVSSRDEALTVPIEALFSEGGTDYVYVVNNGTLKKTEITVGATTDTEVEVLGGIDEGAVVALSGSTQYSDGMAVRVTK